MVRIITDSAADFEPRELEEMGVSCIPITVIFGEREYQENVDLTKEQFYRLLEAPDACPKTAQPSPVILGEMLQQAKDAGDEAVYICLSSALSGTCQSALMVCGVLEWDGCHVVDSKGAAGAQRLLVEYAVKLRDQGCSAAQIARETEALQKRITLYACIDTLEYLYRGGRISHTVYKVGSLAQVKPLIRLSESGGIEVPGKAIGMRKGIDFLNKLPMQDPPDPAFPVYVMYTGNRTNAELLADKLRQQGIDIDEHRMVNVGAAIGSHVGPNGCGIVYVKNQ